ncbi:MAG: DnaB-like helicase C-terminal domain-containing protein, partial [Candidatus Subteraquimicrobiales bacterium]|nr:DnaB-like helicase C-terminal domain-containing protein [Candidatus Subteraquimicrobiales bacterium]
KNQAQQKEREPLAAVTRALKLMANELGVPVMVLSSLNREAEKRTDKRPSISDLRESGSIESDADVVALLYREDYYDKDCDSRGELEAIIAKNRHGETGKVIMMFDRRRGLIAEMDRYYGENYG